jgi:hypothetical protein
MMLRLQFGDGCEGEARRLKAERADTGRRVGVEAPTKIF